MIIKSIVALALTASALGITGSLSNHSGNNSVVTMRPVVLAHDTAGAPTALAGGCGSVPPCGAVKNGTHDTMLYTLVLSDTPTGSGPDLCAVWNHDGGDKYRQITVHCKQWPLAPGGSKGGWTNDGKDVDAFTFANHGYHVREGHLGYWHWIPAGVWTKIRDDQTGSCEIRKGGATWCTYATF